MRNALQVLLWIAAFCHLTACGGSGASAQMTATHFSVSATSNAISGTAFSFQVMALDATGAVASTYSGMVRFSSTDTQAVLPAISALPGGAGTFSATMKTSGNQTITVSDSLAPSINGSSGPIHITLPGLSITTAALPVGTLGAPYGSYHGKFNCHMQQECPIDFFELAATGGSGIYSWSWAAGPGSSIPPGLNCCTWQLPTEFPSPIGTRVYSPVIYGEPTQEGTYQVIVAAKDVSSSAQGSATFTIQVSGGSAQSAKTSALQSAPKHHHYKLIDLGTFGGTGSGVNGEPPVQNFMNNAGTVVGYADTSALTPEPGCYSPNLNQDCFIVHAFAWSGNGLKDLGTLPNGNFSFAAAINQSGQIAGLSEINQVDPITGNPQFRAVLWAKGKTEDLGTLGGTASFAVGLNDLGQVAGVTLNKIPDPYSILGLGSQLTLTQTRGFIWQKGEMQDLGSLGGPDTWPGFVNDLGQVAGASYTSYEIDPNSGTTPNVGVFLWQNGKMRDLGNLGGDNTILGITSLVYGLNNRGEVTGTMVTAGNQFFHAFLWDGDKLYDLGPGTLGGNYSFAQGINDEGEIAGVATLPGDQTNHAFFWRNGMMTDLGTLGGDPCSVALSVDSNGQVFGASESAAGGCQEWTTALLWENGGPSVDLNDLVTNASGAHLDVAFLANKSGEIVSEGSPAGCDNSESCQHAYVLIPCDENHLDVEGCDYSMVDAQNSVKTDPSEPLKMTGAAAAAASTLPGISQAGMLARFRSMRLGHNLPSRDGVVKTN